MKNENTKSDNKEMLGTAPVGKLLLKLAIPTIAAQIINMLYNLVDRVYIGHIPETGALALTGLGVCMPILLIVSAFAALVGAGGAPRASIYMGKGDQEKAEKTVGNSFTMLLIIAAILTTILLIFGEDLLMVFGASANTIPYAKSYMQIYAIGTVFVQVTLGMNLFITAQGFTRTSMISVLIGAITNIILDPIFIFGFKLGVRGAALATIISQAISCVWVLSFLFGKKTTLKITAKNMKLDRKIILPAMALGTATFIMQASESIVSVCFNSSLLKYGGDIAVGAMTILLSIMQFAMLPLQGLGQGAQPIISYNFGAGNKERVKKAFKCLLLVSVIFSTSLWAFVMIAPRVFASMFSADPALLDFTAGVIRIYALCIGIFGIQIACQLTFTAIGEAKSSIIVAVMRKFILLLPLIYIMPAIMKSNQTIAVYMAEPIADFISVVFTVVLFYFQFRKALANMDKAPNAAVKKSN